MPTLKNQFLYWRFRKLGRLMGIFNLPSYLKVRNHSILCPMCEIKTIRKQTNKHQQPFVSRPFPILPLLLPLREGSCNNTLFLLHWISEQRCWPWRPINQKYCTIFRQEHFALPCPQPSSQEWSYRLQKTPKGSNKCLVSLDMNIINCVSSPCAYKRPNALRAVGRSAGLLLKW